jgi:threonyl-tRNA synthetase
VLGSLERFIGILIEEYSGRLPLWISPIQVRIVTITNHTHSYISSVLETLLHNDIRAELDNSSETISYKIKKSISDNIPILIILGKQEIDSNSLSVRMLGKQDTTDMSIRDLISYIHSQSKINNLKKVNSEY